MNGDLWIEIPRWQSFQHYRDRDPIWIKNYTALLHNPDYLGLTGHERGVLHGLWLAYASSHRQLAVDTLSLTRQLGVRVSSTQLASLNHAGFITVSASAPRALARQDKKSATTSQTEQTVPGAADAALPDNTNHNSNHLVDRLLTEIRDANSRTATVLQRFEQSLPDAAFAAALESLRWRRQQSGKPPLHSEARYVVAALATMEREGQYRR